MGISVDKPNAMQFYHGIYECKTKEEVIAMYEEKRPVMFVPGAGIVSQANSKVLEIEPMTHLEAYEYTLKEAIPYGPAFLIPLTAENRWFWGVWLTGPDDFFVDTNEDEDMYDYQIMNHYRDYIKSMPRDRTQPIEFLRL